ncbi:MAG: helix-turn-helix domain-containing protein [Chloroflexota bacterium]
MPYSEPLPELWLRDVEKIKVYADPLRLKIVKGMADPITVKELAKELGLPPTKLYYHVNLLHKHGLIQVIDHNLETGIVEKIYQVAARHFKLVNPLIADEPFPTEAASALFSAMLEETAQGFLRALASRGTEEEEPPRHPFFSKKAFRLTEDQLTSLHAKLDKLIQEVTALGIQNADSNEPQYELTLTFYKSAECD